MCECLGGWESQNQNPRKGGNKNKTNHGFLGAGGPWANLPLAPVYDISAPWKVKLAIHPMTFLKVQPQVFPSPNKMRNNFELAEGSKVGKSGVEIGGMAGNMMPISGKGRFFLWDTHVL